MNNKIFADYPDVVNVKELQEMLGIGRNLAYSLLTGGKVKAIKVGREYKIIKNSIIDYVSNN